MPPVLYSAAGIPLLQLSGTLMVTVVTPAATAVQPLSIPVPKLSLYSCVNALSSGLMVMVTVPPPVRSVRFTAAVLRCR